VARPRLARQPRRPFERLWPDHAQAVLSHQPPPPLPARPGPYLL